VGGKSSTSGGVGREIDPAFAPIDGNRPQSAVNLPLGGINRGCGQIHGERERERERKRKGGGGKSWRRRRHPISACCSVRVHRPPASPASPQLLLSVRTCSSCTSVPARPSPLTGRTSSRRPSAPARLPPSPVCLLDCSTLLSVLRRSVLL